LVRNESCGIAFTAHYKHSHEMGFDHQGCSDLNALYWITHIPDRKPVLYIKEKG